MKKTKQNTEDTVFSFPEKLTVEPSPHAKGKMSTDKLMLRVICALVPALGWGLYVFGWRVLLLAGVSMLACVFFEWGYRKLMKRADTIGDLSAVLTGLLLAMNVPVDMPVWMLIAGDFFAIVIVKQLFGGLGRNIVNPALAARVFLFAWPEEMTSFAPPLDAVASATPLVTLKDGSVEGLSLIDMFFGKIPGCIGEVSAFLLILGGLYLIISKVITWHIPVSYLGTVAILTFCFAGDAPNLTFMAAELCAGGLMLAAFFMATDYATSPITPLGRIIYGVICGALTVFIRFFGANPEGASYAVLISNLLVWYIDKYTMPRRFGASPKGRVKGREAAK